MDNDQPPRDELDEEELRRKQLERKEKKKKKRRSTAHLRESTASHASVSEDSSSLVSSTVADNQSARSSVRSVDGGRDPRKQRSSQKQSGSSPRKAASNTDSLDQMEQDVLAKSIARTSRTSAAARYARKSTPSATDTPTNNNNNNNNNNNTALSQLEQDVMAKNQGRNVSSRGGEHRSSLQNLEEQVAARSSSNQSEASHNYDNEKVAAATGGARRPTSRSTFNAKPQQSATISPGKQPQQQSISSLQQMEDDIVAKRQAGRPITATAAVGTTAAIAASNNNAAAPPEINAAYASGVADEQQIGKMKQAQTNAALEAAALQGSEMNEVNLNGDDDIDIGIGVGVAATVRDPFNEQNPGSLRESALPPGGNSLDIENGGIDRAEIEAFVAHNVVDATGVAVVMSEAEEERLERKKNRKYFMCGIACFILVAIGIVLAVVFTVGQPKEAEPLVPTAMPSVAPSSVPSFAPTTTQLDAWIDELIPFSGEEAFMDISTPQYRAAVWLADEDELQLPIGDPRGIQRYFLATFYFALDGDSWVQCGRLDPSCGGDPDERSWLLDREHECDWLGVGCDITATTVTTIFFSRQLGNGLKGTLPPELAGLTALAGLILQNNDLTGTLPTFLGKCKQLSALFLLGNNFDGSIPSELLTGATMLGTIHLGGNQLTGTIPSAIANLPIRTLNLANNHLEGSIPEEVGRLTMMTHLELDRNNITSNIPEGLYDLTSLTRIRLYENKLLGTLSSKLGQMSELEEFRVGKNAIAGSLPQELYQMERIVDFRCENAALTGTLSDDIRNLNETLRRVILGENKMGGPLPIAGIELCTRMNELELHGNTFTGTISKSICNEKGGRFFDLQNLTVPPEVDCTIKANCCNLQA